MIFHQLHIELECTGETSSGPEQKGATLFSTVYLLSRRLKLGPVT